MKFFRNLSILFLPFLLLASESLSSQVTIIGKVTFSELDLPLPGSQVDIFTEDGQIDTMLVSDFTGCFEFKTDLIEGEILLIEYADVCNGDVNTITVPIDGDRIEVLIRHCLEQSNSCDAHFIWHPLEELSIQFLDLSHPQEIVKWNWDFGDNSSSSAQNPVHEYEIKGVYSVTLEILGSDSCRSSFTQDVWVDTFPCFCPEYAFPVCVISASGDKITFDNPCFAACEGYDVFVACDDACGCDSSYAPVCIQAPFGALTFQNMCEAECAGFSASDTCRPICICPDIWDPVCVDLPDGTTLQFSNDCEAQCEGYTDYYSCNPDSCICPAIYDPVCAIGFDGDIKTFDNECEARCDGYFFTFPCDSSCFCDDVYDPVCILVPHFGWKVEIRNACIAECLGLEIVSCDDCICPEIYDPVCVLADNGDILQFDNYCLAQCAGYEVTISCEGDCFCEGIYDPVCVFLEDGTVQKYQSACQAFCDGYDVVYNCENICDCPSTILPVCVLMPDGTYKEFSNECMANCFGYFDIVTCPGFRNDEGGMPGYNDAKQFTQVHIFPNPVKTELQVQWLVPNKTELHHIYLMDVQGKKLQDLVISGGQSNWNISLDEFKEGFYYLVIQGPQINEIHKVVKVE